MALPNKSIYHRERNKGFIFMANSFSEKLRALRKERHLTLDKLAELTETSKSYLWELENKDLPRPSADKIIKIAKVLEVTIDYLLDTENQHLEAAEDLAFFRKYQGMNESTKEKIRRMLELLNDT